MQYFKQHKKIIVHVHKLYKLLGNNWKFSGFIYDHNYKLQVICNLYHNNVVIQIAVVLARQLGL